MRSFIKPLLLFALLIAYSLPSQVLAQSATSAAITGTIKDSQGAAISGAVVTARQLDTNAVRTITSDDQGNYTVVQLAPGNYELMVTASGFATKTMPVLLTIGSTTLNNFSLTVGSTTEVIEVNASNSLLEASKTEKSETINNAAIQNLPINRRNFLDFTLTTSGVVQDRSRFQGAQATSGLYFNGQNARQNNVTIDGVDNNDSFSGSVRASYSQEAVKEFQVVSNSFAAEFGRAQGGIINIVTRTGSNEPHASLFVLNRNDQLSARNAFSVGKPDFSQYQFGATLSGPIKKDKAFLFSSFERLTVSDSILVTIPDSFVAAFNRQGFPVRAGDIPFSETSSTLLLRTDYQVSKNDQLALRYNLGRLYNGALATFGDTRAESQGGRQRVQDDNFSLTNTYYSSKFNLINETRFLFARRNLKTDSLDPNGGPRVQIGFTLGQDPFLPSIREEFISQIIDNVSLIRGRHQFKFGVDYLHSQLPKDSTFVPIGFGGQVGFQALSFAGFTLGTLQVFDPSTRTPQQQAILALASAQLPSRFPGFPFTDLTKVALPTQYLQGFGDPFIELHYNYLSSYAQDDIRLTPKLTAKLGLRYDLERIQYVPNNKGNFSPRVGLAYQATTKLNLHAAYGIFHGITPYTPILQSSLGRFNGARGLVLTFPFSIIPFSLPGHKFPASLTLPTSVPFIRQLGFEQDIQADFKNGYTQQVNVGFDYQLLGNILVSASYQYVRGIRLVLSRDINPVVRPLSDPVQSRVTGRIDTSRGTVLELESNGDSYYNALTLEAERRFGTRLGLRLNYTFSKTLDDFTDYRLENAIFQNPLNLRGERGFSTQDVRNRFVLSTLWKLDYTKNIFLRDFQLSTIITAESGRPYYVGLGFDKDRNADLIPGDRPDGVPRNAGLLKGFASLDMRLIKQIRIKDHYSIEGFVEGFNLLNRTNLSSTTLATALPGIPRNDGRFDLPRDRYGSAFNARQLQLGLRLSF